jgi:GTP-binding protein
MWTLLHLKFRKHIFAEDGEKGGGKLCSGKAGKDVVLDVPLGTVAKDFETGEILAEINDHDEEFILLGGGKGGQGNAHFKSPTNQSPTYSQPGHNGVEKWVILELKLLADVGLVGFPNAGKSTLLSVVSAAKPEIASYPFTTLVPSLGIVNHRQNNSFVMADIPGIIEGAAEGRGLGTRFLKHIERNACLLFIVPIDADDVMGQYKILLKELKAFNPELLTKDRILAISKVDIVDLETRSLIEKEMKRKMPRKHPIDYIFFSSATGYQVEELKDMLWDRMNRA